jgi:hypothetical protein
VPVNTMRIYLVPISTRRTLLYCQRLNVTTGGKLSLVDRIQDRAAKTWADWEKKEKGWQKWVVNQGNYAFRRIPHEEWGLKSVPPLSQRRKADELKGTESVEVIYPQSLIATDKVPGILQKLATERESLHRKRLMWCFIGMPISAPVALVPLYVLLSLQVLYSLSRTLTLVAESRTSRSSTSCTEPGRTGGLLRVASTSSFSSRRSF